MWEPALPGEPGVSRNPERRPTGQRFAARRRLPRSLTCRFEAQLRWEPVRMGATAGPDDGGRIIRASFLLES